jgi:glycopeptide antibiotics resistance protein
MGDIRSVAEVLPWAIPVLAVFGILAVLGARSLARLLDSPWWVGVLLVMSIGSVVAITLTQQDVDASLRAQATDPSLVLIATPLLRPPWQWWSPSDRLLNIVLFMPLGFAVWMVRRRSLRRWLVAAAVALPLMVEGSQFAVTWLRRDPQWQDVLDNAIGVGLGMAIGALVTRWLADRRSSTHG